MVREKGFFLVIIAGIFFLLSGTLLFGQNNLYSEQIAEIFIKQASEIHDRDPLDSVKTQQATAFIQAARQMSPMSSGIPFHILKIATADCFNPLTDPDSVSWALGEYLREKSDVKLAFDTVGCMQQQLNRRLDREVELAKLGSKYAKQNPHFSSEVFTQLGFLAMEKSDIAAAANHFLKAAQLNSYNDLAMSNFLEFARTQDPTQKSFLELALLRTRLTVNPYDFDAAVEYANKLRDLQVYEIAARAYKYAAELFDFLNKDTSIVPEFVQSWALCCYHMKHSEGKTLEIAERYRTQGHFDLLLETVVGKSLIKLGQTQEGNQKLNLIAKQAEASVSESPGSQGISPEQLAWLYSFVLNEPEKALAWANRAFETAPDQLAVRSIFAYTLAANAQYELAKEYINSLAEMDQVANVTMSLIQLSEEKKNASIESLRKAVDMAPESLVAEKALELLEELEADYIASPAPESIQQQLEESYPVLIPPFQIPTNRYTARLNFSGSDFLYGVDFPARLVIENLSSEPFVISNEGLLTGNLRVNAKLEGDLQIDIPNLYTTQFRPDKPILPDSYYSVPLDLNRGKLRQYLLTYPQAQVSITFTVHLETINLQTSELQKKPKIQTTIRRRGVELTSSFLMQRLDVLTKGQIGQKYQVSSLFTGLLAERTAMQSNHVKYPHQSVEQELLIDSVRKLLVDKEWKIRVHVMDRLSMLSVPLNSQMIMDISNNLNHENWPVRLSAMYLLQQVRSDSFSKVLNWTAEHDPNPHVRELAVALGAKTPDPETKNITEEENNSTLQSF